MTDSREVRQSQGSFSFIWCTSVILLLLMVLSLILQIIALSERDSTQFVQVTSFWAAPFILLTSICGFSLSRNPANRMGLTRVTTWLSLISSVCVAIIGFISWVMDVMQASENSDGEDGTHMDQEIHSTFKVTRLQFPLLILMAVILFAVFIQLVPYICTDEEVPVGPRPKRVRRIVSSNPLMPTAKFLLP